MWTAGLNHGLQKQGLMIKAELLEQPRALFPLPSMRPGSQPSGVWSCESVPVPNSTTLSPLQMLV